MKTVPDPSLVFYQNFSEAAYKRTAIKTCIVLQVSCTQYVDMYIMYSLILKLSANIGIR